ncbi:MAG: cryptochrome/photolyase family protein [Luminiphilus sp.]|nr:cryptochrome/photolyase family protein [Luminiphilus sp.]
MQPKVGILILGDQLSWHHPALTEAVPGETVVILAEVAEEALYVRHNRHKIVLLFSAMRHFATALQKRGFDVQYYRFEDGVASLLEACSRAHATWELDQLQLCEPGEYRLSEQMEGWSEQLGIPVSVLADSRFLASRSDFADWAAGRKQYRMEYFYREMRKRYGFLMEGSQPEGGKWNYDAENRSGWRGQCEIPARLAPVLDDTTSEVIETVLAHFPYNPGDLTAFRWSVTHEAAQAELDWFCEHALPLFGTYQDALAESSPWLFHGLISMYLNCGLLEPLAVCEQVETAYRRGHCSLAAAEGFIRQVLGWREYVRGLYWYQMPDYRELNALAAVRPLPEWFWTGSTDMRCLSQALKQSLDLGYAHHIQRLMVIGNFALIAGLSVSEVCDWYLAVYTDAYEWVELPNTLGMALFADGGIMASKPYAASGKYIQKQGDHCKACRYDPKKVTGDGACPYNSLYWDFIHRHSELLGQNPRMGLILGGWRKRAQEDRQAVLEWAENILDDLSVL